MINFGQESSYTYPHSQPLSQHVPFYNAYLPFPCEDQNILAPTNQHAIPIYMTRPPLFVRDSTDETTPVVVSESPCNPSITESHSDQAKENLNIYDQHQVAPTGQHDHPQITGKSSGGSSSDGGGEENSKIVITSRPRHRRMRLSIDVAREFFDLHDKLKFERASKTVEWLLIKAKPDIEMLPENEGSSSTSTPKMKKLSSSDICRGPSGLDEIGITGGDQAGISSKSLRKERKRYKRSPLKRPPINPLRKELRGKARERARERTKGKMSRSLATLDLTAVNDYPGPTITNPRQDHLSQQSIQSMAELRNDFNINMIAADPSPFDQPVMFQVYGSHEPSMFEKEPVANFWNFRGHMDLFPTTSTTSAPLFNPLVDEMVQYWNPILVANSQHNFGGSGTTATGLGVLKEPHVSNYL